MEMAMNQEEAANNSICLGSMVQECSICLRSMVQETYLEKCFHKFCFNCIQRWSKVESSKQSLPPSTVSCPLCKTESPSVIVFPGPFFQKHYVDRQFQPRFTFSESQKYRLQCYYNEIDDIFDVSRFWKSGKYRNSNVWLQSWLERELQALMQEEDVHVVMHHIHGVIDSFFRRLISEQTTRQLNKKLSAEAIQEEFKIVVAEAAKQFLPKRTDRFVKEVELFLASGFNIEAYDAVYMQRLGRPGSEH